MSNPTSFYRETTWAAIILGIFQGIVLNIAFVYTALKLGFSLPGSTLAAIIGYFLLRVVLKRGTIIENNINQTIASGINSAGIGVVFVLPSIFFLGLHQQPAFSFWTLGFAAIAGAFLGVLLIIPLRRQLIERERLRFPSGVAVATILRSANAGRDKVRLLFIGALVSAAWKLIMQMGWLDSPGRLEAEEFLFDFGVIPLYLAPALYLSLMNVAAGMLSGRAGLPFFIGGVLAWWIVSPAVVSLNWLPTYVTDVHASDFIYTHMLRPLGIGMLIGAAAMELVRNLPLIGSALLSVCRASMSASRSDGQDELPLHIIVPGVAVAVILMFCAALLSSDVSLLQAVITALIGTLWLGIAAIVVAQASGLTDISPVSGLTMVSMIIMLFLVGSSAPGAFVLTIAVAVAVGLSADMMQDLKTGFLVGSRPIAQQLLQFASAWFGVILAFGAVYVLWISGTGGSGGFGPDTPLPAPQAGALAGIVETVQRGDVPLDKYLLGGIIGFLFSSAPIAGLGVLAGLAMYLPFSITLGYGIGCFINMAYHRAYGPDFIEDKIVPLAAGLIIGEALMGVGHALFSILSA
jgi:putative OPT family oligopeptide transporter